MAILIRPVREQLEHDRVIRALQAKNRKKFEISVNLGEDRVAPVKLGPQVFYPDLVYVSAKAPKKIQGVVEVETGESVNGLEAKAQWANFGRVRAPFHLYVPVGSVDSARRLCDANHVALAELWSYVTAGDEVRFALVHRSAVAAARGDGRRTARGAAAKKAAARRPKAAAPRKAKPAKAKARGAAARPAAKAKKTTAAKAKKAAKKAPARKQARAAAKKVARKSAKPSRVQKKR